MKRDLRDVGDGEFSGCQSAGVAEERARLGEIDELNLEREQPALVFAAKYLWPLSAGELAVEVVRRREEASPWARPPWRSVAQPQTKRVWN